MGKALSRDEIAGYERDGFVAPVSLMPPGEMARVRGRLEDFMAEHPQAANKLYKSAHMLFRWLYDLVAAPRLADAVEDLIGPNILCFNADFRIKEPASEAYVGWHQDHYYLRYEPLWITALIAFSDQTAKNGCLHIVPGSHLGPLLRQEDTDDERNMLSRGQRIVEPFDESRAVPVEIKAGEVLLFHPKLIHGSPANRSRERRILLLACYCPPETRREGSRERAILVRGIDAVGNFDREPRPEGDYGPGEIRRHREKVTNLDEKSLAGARRRQRALP